MKKKLLTALCVMATLVPFAQVKKQKRSTFSIGAEGGYALSKIRYSNSDRFGLGGSLQQEFLQKRTGITINLGYFYPNDYYFVEHQVWLMAGLRYYVTKNLFVAGQLGPGIIKGNDFAGGSFVYAPGVGLKCKPVDISLHYRGTFVSGETLSIIGVRAALAF